MKSRRLIVAPDTQGAAWPPFAVQYKKIINTDWSIRNAKHGRFGLFADTRAGHGGIQSAVV
jgi:hypothetical protein